MNWQRIKAVTRADLRQLVVSRDYWIPMLVLASLFFIVVPIIALGSIASIQQNEVASRLGQVIEVLPENVQSNIQGDNPRSQAAYAIAVYLLAPIAVVVPLTVAGAVGSNAIVGERERGTGEFLAHSPITERELYIGKMMSALIPGYIAVVLGFTMYSILVNLIVGPSVGGWFFPTGGWWVLILWVVPPFIAIAVALIVRISARVQSAAAAQQAASLVSLPVIVLAFSVSSGLVYDPARSGVIAGAVAWIIAITLIMNGAAALNRERLLGIGIGAKKRVVVPSQDARSGAS